MRCRSCGEDTEVIDVRRTTRRGAMWRRRQCTGCAERVTTYELRADDLPHLPDSDAQAIRRDRNAAIMELMEDGAEPEDIATAFGLTPGYVRHLYGDARTPRDTGGEP